jgi:hypothetical protein
MSYPGEHRLSNNNYASAVLSAVNATVSLDSGGAGSFVAQVTATAPAVGGVLTFEGRINDTAPWVVLSAIVSNGTSKATAIAASAAITTVPVFAWFVQCQGMAQVRARASALTSGSMTVAIRITPQSLA